MLSHGTTQILYLQRPYSKAILRCIKERKYSFIASQGKAVHEVKYTLRFTISESIVVSNWSNKGILHSRIAKADLVHPRNDATRKYLIKTRSERLIFQAWLEQWSSKCHHCLSDRTLTFGLWMYMEKSQVNRCRSDRGSIAEAYLRKGILKWPDQPISTTGWIKLKMVGHNPNMISVLILVSK